MGVGVVGGGAGKSEKEAELEQKNGELNSRCESRRFTIKSDAESHEGGKVAEYRAI